MKPFLKWAGGKSWFAKRHKEIFPQSYKTYYEPFIGSGSVFFSLLPKKAYLSDTNQLLIDTYKAIRDYPQQVIKNLRKHERLHSKEHYYLVRSNKPRSPAKKAARFIYLNRTCFNGLYRVNSEGQFNVPKGSNNKVVLPSDDFTAISTILSQSSKIQIKAQDFQKTIKQASSEDFVYIDPPYTVKHNNNCFIQYNEDIFSWKDQERLVESAEEAHARGVKILISNADHQSIKKLYRNTIWNQHRTERTTLMASNPKNRGKTTELIISNYTSLLST